MEGLSYHNNCRVCQELFWTKDAFQIVCNNCRIKELEKQNKELLKFLVDDYITCKDGQHPGHRDLKRFLEQIKQKPIEEILKEV